MQDDIQQTPWDGMLPQHPCKWCGKLLNQDGYHPAELYAGTYTGLCSSCESFGPRILQEFYDGCKLISHPPSTPSHRRQVGVRTLPIVWKLMLVIGRCALEVPG